MKQFDEEYKAYVRENAPDLWDRIEAGVDAKISASSVSGKSTNHKNGKKNMQRYFRFAASLAACLAALLLTIPVFHMISDRRAGESKTDATPQLADITIENAQNDSLQFAQETAPEAETPEVAEESGLTETAEEATEVEEIVYEGDNAAGSQETADQGRGETLQEKGAAEMETLGSAQYEQTEQSEDGEANSVLQPFSQETPIETAYVQILGKEQTADGFVYTVEILEDNGGNLQEAQSWVITASEKQAELAAEGRYHITVKEISVEERTAVLECVQTE